jgi:subtilisin family serine protease
MSMRRRGQWVAAALVAAMAAVPMATSQAAPAGPDQPSRSATPGKAAVLKEPGALPGQWIVVLKEGTSDKTRRTLMNIARSGGASALSQYRLTVNGFAGTMSDKVVQRLRTQKAVEFIEADQVVQAAGVQNPGWWNTDRIDQRALPLSGTYNYDETGTGVRAYVVDSGVRLDHVEFTGRILPGYDFLDGDTDANDCDYSNPDPAHHRWHAVRRGQAGQHRAPAGARL